MLTSSSAPGGNSNSCAPGLAVSSVTSDARSRATLCLRIALVRCSISPTGFAIKSSVSAVPRSLVARPRGGQRQGPGTLRVWLQSLDCHACHRAQRRAVRAACQGPARQSFDGHTLGPVIADLEKLTGVAARRIHGDKGYRGHNYPDRFKVWISVQVRRVTKAIRREMRRRAAVEPVIGHLKDDHRMRRNHLKGRNGDRITPFSPPPATTSACSATGSRNFYASCYG
ncbi:hypothetical protein ACVIHH_008297 [Bradyrhizobium sp. USDA 4518]